MTNETTPIIVNPDPTAEQIAAASRYVLTSVGSYALGKGWIDGDLLQMLTGVVTVLAPLAYGVWRTKHNRAKLVTAASAAPNTVAIVKGSADA